jgi:hypothetical protein
MTRTTNRKDSFKILTREEVIGAKDIKIERVDVPEWGGSIFVKGMSGTERDHYEVEILSARGTDRQANFENLRAKLASLTVCDQEGHLLFTQDDIEALASKSSRALQRIFIVAQRLSGLSQADVAALAKELEEVPLDDSASA